MGLSNHSKGALGEFLIDLLRGVTDHCHFYIVDQTRTIHSNALQHTLLHPIDEDGVQSDLDGMCAHSEKNHPLSADRLCDPFHHLPQIFSCQDLGQGVQKIG